MFTAENEDVLVVFQSLCKQYPHENPVALWEMAGGQVAAEQQRAPDGLTPGQSEQVRQMIQNALDTGSA